MTIEIDHLPASALLDLDMGEVGAGFVGGFDFRAKFDAMTLGVDVEFSDFINGTVVRLVLPFAVVNACRSMTVCGFLGDRLVEALA